MRLRDHWARTAPLWAHGEAVLAWHVLPAGQLDGLAAQVAPLLELACVTPVPLQWLHLTLRDVGRESEVADVEAVLAAARERLVALAPVDAVAGPLRVVEEGVTADVEPRAALAAIHEAVGGDGGLWPHVSFAYAHADGAELAPLAAELAAPFRIERVSLVRQRREPRRYAWDVLAELPLGP